MRRLIPILTVLLLLFNPARSFASPEIHKSVLDNGLTVLVTPMPSSEVVSIYMYVKTGAATEGRFTGAGISHFIEHMLFKGTQRRAVGAIAKEVKSLGGNINASTDLDYTIYTLDLPKDKLKQGVDIIADMLRNSVFDKEEVEKERKVIHGEMRLYYDRPIRRLSVDVFKNVFKHHPYQHTTIGYESLFDGISRDDLYGYYQRNYIPNNMILSLAGGLDADEGLKLAQEFFGTFKPKPYPQHNIVPEPPQISERYYEEYYDTPLFWFSLAFQGMALNDPDVYAMDLLSMVLGGGQGSRFYKDIYQNKKLVAQISCINYTPHHKGVFEIEGTMDKDNLAKVRESVLAIVDDVKRRGITTEELAKIKVKASASLIYDNQTSSSIAYKAATDEAMTGDYRFSEHYVAMIKKVTNDDIKRVANRYLNTSSLSVTVVKPLAAKPKPSSKSQQKDSGKIEKIVLDNGLTLLLKEDHTAALVSLQAVLHGGLRSENKDNNGIANLFTSVWTKATKRQSEAQMIKDLEGRAASCGAYSGYNALGITMNFLSTDIDYGLNLFADVIKNPVFEDSIIERQRDAILVAIKSRDDDIRAMTFRRAMAVLYEKHPNHMDILGTNETITKITRKDLETYYARFVEPSNLVISVFGDIDAAKVKASLIKSLGGLKRRDVDIPVVLEPELKSPRMETIKTKKSQAVLAMTFLAPAFADKDRFAMEVINTTLGAGLSGRLFVKVRDQLGKAYTVGSSYTPGFDTGNITLFCLTTNAKVDSVKEIMAKEIADLKEQFMSDEELNSVKAYMKGSHQMGLNTVGAQAAHSAFNTLYGLGYDYDEHFNKFVDAVSKEDVKAAANKYLNSNQAVTITTLGEDKS